MFILIVIIKNLYYLTLLYFNILISNHLRFIQYLNSGNASEKQKNTIILEHKKDKKTMLKTLNNNKLLVLMVSQKITKYITS